MTDSDEWSPEKDKDPVERSYELMEKYLKKITDTTKAGILSSAPPAGGPFIGAAYAVTVDPIFHVRSISNGFVAAHLKRTASGVKSVESFCKTAHEIAQAFVGHVEALAPGAYKAPEAHDL